MEFSEKHRPDQFMATSDIWQEVNNVMLGKNDNDVSAVVMVDMNTVTSI